MLASCIAFRRYLDKVAFYKKFGYDVEKEREFIIAKARPFGGRILEVGTGKGAFALALAKKGYFLTSIDISKEFQDAASGILSYLGLNKQVELTIADAQDLPFARGVFDTVFSVNFLHHLSSAERALKEMARVLSSQGKIVISDFNEAGLALLDKIYASKNDTHHAYRGNMEKAKHYLAGEGFNVSWYENYTHNVIVARRRD